MMIGMTLGLRFAVKDFLIDSTEQQKYDYHLSIKYEPAFAKRRQALKSQSSFDGNTGHRCNSLKVSRSVLDPSGKS